MTNQNYKFIIIIPSYNRREHLLKCLEYINKIKNKKKFLKEVRVATNKPIDKEYKFKLKTYILNSPYKKTSYLNKCLEDVKDYTHLLFIDSDMLLPYNFFKIFHKITRNKHINYITLQGHKLRKVTSELILQGEEFDGYLDIGAERFVVSPSQIIMTKKVYELFLEIFGYPLWNENYKGWGCEDSEISFKSTYLYKRKLIKKRNINDVWFHLYHENTYNEEEYNKNKKIFDQALKIAQQKLKQYLKTRKKYEEKKHKR